LNHAEIWAHFQEHAASYDFKEIFDKMRLAQGEELQMYVSILLYKFHHVLKQNANTLPLDAETLTRVALLGANALMLVKSIIQNGNYTPQDDGYCQKLLPMHFLHALVFAQSDPDEIVAGASLTTVALKDMREAGAILANLKKEGIALHSPYSLTLLRLSIYGLAPETQQLFRAWVIALDRERRENDLKVLAKMVVLLSKLDLLPVWLNIAFPRNQDLHQLVMDFTAQAKFFKELAWKRKTLDAMNLSAFANPKSFHTQWREMQRTLIDDLKSQAFFNSYKRADQAGKVAAIALMNKIVDQFDQAIKTLERSPEIPENQKLVLFQTMLKEFNSIACKWVYGFDFLGSLEGREFVDVNPESLPSRINERLDKTTTTIFRDSSQLSSADFAFSRDFDVNAFSSKSGAMLLRVELPQTLEDAFSAIHQELLTMLGILNHQAIGSEMRLPPLFARAIEELNLSSHEFSQRSAILNGIDLNSKGVTYSFSRSLRDHGVQYQLHAPLGKNRLELRVRFSAENEGNRWEKIAQFMLMLKVTGKLDVDALQVSTCGVEYTIHLDSNDDFAAVNTILLNVEESTSSITDYKSFDKGENRLVSLQAAQQVQNPRKQLKPVVVEEQIIQEFERVCTIASMLSCSLVQDCMRKLVTKNPAFVVSFMQKAWRSNETSQFFECDLPQALVREGHAVALVAARGMQLLATSHPLNWLKGLQLIDAVVRQDHSVLPAEFYKQIFAILLDKKFRTEIFPKRQGKLIHENIFNVLATLMKSGEDPERIRKEALLMMQDQDPTIQADGAKILGLAERAESPPVKVHIPESKD